MKRVLVFPCGSEIGLEIYRSLKYSKEFELYGGNSVEDHGMYVYENYISDIPFVDDEQFVEKINEIIKKYNIDYIIPAHDSVVLKLAQNSELVNAKIVTSDKYTCEICRSKKKTYEKFSGIIPIPKMYNKSEIRDSDFPLFLKPDVGQGSKGTKKVNSVIELESNYEQDKLILEYLPGKEYTIDCFTSYDGRLLYCNGRERKRISNGISVNTVEVINKTFEELANKINDTLCFSGAWFFQVKERINGELVLMEIAPRIAGTMELQRAYGINLPLVSLYNADEKDIALIKNKYNVILDRALESKFKLSYEYKNVYIDLDDTLIVNDEVNYMVVAFLYKCLNENKKIFLITRHRVDPIETLNKYKIYNLFDKIIHIGKDDNKSQYIEGKDSIFIDDSFSERKEVYDNKNIPVFDVNMIDVLL